MSVLTEAHTSCSRGRPRECLSTLAQIVFGSRSRGAIQWIRLLMTRSL